MATKTTHHNARTGVVFTGVLPKALPARCTDVRYWTYRGVKYATGYDPKTGAYTAAIPGKDHMSFDTPKDRDDWAKKIIRVSPKCAA